MSRSTRSARRVQELRHLLGLPEFLRRSSTKPRPRSLVARSSRWAVFMPPPARTCCSTAPSAAARGARRHRAHPAGRWRRHRSRATDARGALSAAGVARSWRSPRWMAASTRFNSHDVAEAEVEALCAWAAGRGGFACLQVQHRPYFARLVRLRTRSRSRSCSAAPGFEDVQQQMAVLQIAKVYEISEHDTPTTSELPRREAEAVERKINDATFTANADKPMVMSNYHAVASASSRPSTCAASLSCTSTASPACATSASVGVARAVAPRGCARASCSARRPRCASRRRRPTPKATRAAHRRPRLGAAAHGADWDSAVCRLRVRRDGGGDLLTRGRHDELHPRRQLRLLSICAVWVSRSPAVPGCH